ncbi:MAG TPA: hypothetical protein VJW75_11260 [Candidatus Eisenbacteria bacterium]|nr:hypothetical protein [Candidatus Eisenbacteria bacterium]
MRSASLLLIVALTGSIVSLSALPNPARADSEDPSEETVPEIVLIGEPTELPPMAEGIRAGLVEDFLAARQDASMDRAHAAEVRRLMVTDEDVPTELIAGPRGTRLVAFDYDDAALGADPSADRFEVTTTLLFASRDGQAVETRGERLTFVESEDGWACTEIAPTNVVEWDSEAALERAAEVGIEDEIGQIKKYWLRPEDGTRPVAYALSNVERGPDGGIVISGLRIVTRPGRRGFESEETSIVFTKQDGALRIKFD